MIISVEKAKELVGFPESWTDEKIKMKLLAVEQTIRAYTNNNFQNRGIRSECDIAEGDLHGSFVGFAAGDTVQITGSVYNNGLFVVEDVRDGIMYIDGLTDEAGVRVTKIEYPADVVACAVNLMEWEVQNRGKVGIQSETLSRHSVTYFNMTAAEQVMGYPVSLLGCLKAYRKVRC